MNLQGPRMTQEAAAASPAVLIVLDLLEIAAMMCARWSLLERRAGTTHARYAQDRGCS